MYFLIHIDVHIFIFSYIIEDLLSTCIHCNSFVIAGTPAPFPKKKKKHPKSNLSLTPFSSPLKAPILKIGC